MNKYFLEVWAYAVEIVLSSLALAGAIMIWGAKDISDFIQSSASDVATYFSLVMLAGALGFYWVFYSKSDTDFAKWLYSSGAFKVYERAYLSAILIYLVLTALLLLSKYINNELLNVFSFWFLSLGIINAFTFIKNISGQLRLNMEFNRKNEHKP